jgi:hypothetical protein
MSFLSKNFFVPFVFLFFFSTNRKKLEPLNLQVFQPFNQQGMRESNSILKFFKFYETLDFTAFFDLFDCMKSGLSWSFAVFLKYYCFIDL